MDGKFNERMTLSLDSEQREGLDNVAYEKSEPGQQVSVASVIREAIAEYLEETE